VFPYETANPNVLVSSDRGACLGWELVGAERARFGRQGAHRKVRSVSRVTIEVSGGEQGAPVENASVYLKYVEERKLKKDKKVELNVKTNRDGTAHIPEAPTGRVLVQVVAEGWKTYGRWYDITETKQTIKVRLEKPPRWY